MSRTSSSDCDGHRSAPLELYVLFLDVPINVRTCPMVLSATDNNYVTRGAFEKPVEINYSNSARLEYPGRLVFRPSHTISSTASAELPVSPILYHKFSVFHGNDLAHSASASRLPPRSNPELDVQQNRYQIGNLSSFASHWFASHWSRYDTLTHTRVHQKANSDQSTSEE